MNNKIKAGKAIKVVVKTVDLAISDEKIRVLTNLGQLIKEIQNTLPKNEKGLSNYYVDAQIILDWLTNLKKGEAEEIPERVINNSLVSIDWLEEVPIVGGLPIWERLDCEPIIYYRLFKKYRDSTKEKGISRCSFENLKEVTGIKVKALYALSKIYHWQMRVRCYDLFKEDTLEKEKEKLIGLMETHHRVAARKVFESCMKYLEDVAKGGWYDVKGNLQISPKDMIGWLELAVKLERLSLGLPMDKPVNQEDRVKIDKIVVDSKTLNIGKPNGENKYLQELVDILDIAGALPKKIAAKGDMQKELKRGDRN